MTVLADNLEKFAELQKQGFEPMRRFTGVAVDAFEKIARKNYAFYGDMLEYAVSAARLPVDVSEPKELFERQAASTKAFGELLSQHANEYVELGRDFQATATELFNKDVVQPVKEVAAGAKKKAA